MNKCMIIGNLVRDPEMKTMNDGGTVCQFTVAVNRKLRNGEKTADFINVSAWERLADLCAQYLAKGAKVMVSGRASARGWIGRDGNARAAMEISANEVEFLNSRRDDVPAAPAASETSDEFTEVDDDEVPF